MTPDNVRAYTAAGHEVYIERGAGVGSGFADEEYALAGAAMLDDAAEVWRRAEMMVKVKEPFAFEDSEDKISVADYLKMSDEEKEGLVIRYLSLKAKVMELYSIG